MTKPIALLLVLAAPVVGQQKLSLTKPTAEWTEPFTTVASVRELPNGKVLVVDRSENLVQLLDLAAGTATKVGREGKGPEEYTTPNLLFPLPDGSTLMQDMGNLRFLTILPDGKVGKIVTIPQPSATQTEGQGGGIRLGRNLGPIIGSRGVDAKGNLYFSAPSFSLDGSPQDSLPILRWDRVKPTFDTVAWLEVPPDQRPTVTRSSTAGGQAFSFRMGSNSAWPRQTAWGADQNGRIVMVTPEPYRVTWLSGRTRTAGPAVPYKAPRVTEADKKAWLDRAARSRPTILSMGTGGGAGGGARTATAPPPSETEWPETLPPFSGATAALVTPEGQVWVLRVLPASEKNPRYDIFDATGKLIGDATLRPDSRVIGFGKGTVYVVRSDEDDLQYLERYAR